MNQLIDLIAYVHAARPKTLRIMRCGFAGLLFVDLLCFLASCVYDLSVFEKKS